jgi:hypothetical protein
MGFADRLRAWFRGDSSTPAARRRRQQAQASASPANRAALRELGAFIEGRAGVEAFLEPATTLYPTTLLLVAGDGEYLRRPVGNPGDARKLCEQRAIPLYDAAKVGYPRRMRDYERGIRRESISLEDLPPWPGDDEPPAQTG